MIRLTLAGRKDAARAAAAPAAPAEIATMPALNLKDVGGKPVASSDLKGRIVLVEFWATWCPPCRPTLSWLADLKKKHGDRIEIVALAVESDEADVRKLAEEMNVPIRFALATPDIARSFGDISGVPTLFLFDRNGKGAGVFFGAPPTLHADVEAKLGKL
jgi:thiol-disulfide isomerase/thioredoxin